jgi:hypothetical protein
MPNHSFEQRRERAHVQIGLVSAIIADEECLIFAHCLEGMSKKVIINIRYKMIEGFIVEK